MGWTTGIRFQEETGIFLFPILSRQALEHHPASHSMSKKELFPRNKLVLV
jgi:hypothetical protein